ncbi:MAG: NADH-quinone oxidoreductase subunit N [Nanoarchaeota archaeon]|nr:NADH-quinone oxidoreductase subunit N [Nanoarchaeota archaeon]
MINAEYLLVFGLLILIPIDFLRKFIGFRSDSIHVLTMIVLWLSFVFELFFGNMSVPFFAGFEYSHFVIFFILFLSGVIYTFFFLQKNEYSSTFDLLFIAAVFGATLLILSSNFMSMFLSFEIMTMSMYGLVLFGKTDLRLEGAVKYVLFSAFSTVAMLFGISLIYLSTGSLSFTVIQSTLSQILLLGSLLVLVGLAYEATLVPFHMWAVDTYDASDNSITAFLVLLESSALIMILRIFYFSFSPIGKVIGGILLLLALLTVFVPSLLSITQERVKRMLVYSGISQAGFSFAAISVLTSLAAKSAIFYIFSFAVGEALVFLSLGAMDRSSENMIKYIKNYSPVPAFSLVIALLSLAGVPPFLGFFAKFMLFYSIFSAGYAWLMIILLVLLLFSVFYYFRLMRSIADAAQRQRKKSPVGAAENAILIVLSLVLIFGTVLINYI